MPSLERSRGGQAEMDGLSSLGLNPGLGLNTVGASGAAGLARRRARGAITKLTLRRSEDVKVACPFDGPVKIWTVLSLRVFRLYV